jgi:hypothetical protein
VACEFGFDQGGQVGVEGAGQHLGQLLDDGDVEATGA